jgi:hypothetical protein
MATTASETWDDRLIHLKEDAGWKALHERVADRMEKEFRRTAAQMMAGTEIPQWEIEYRRGFFAGMKFLLDQPDLDAQKMAEAIRRERKETSQ